MAFKTATGSMQESHQTKVSIDTFVQLLQILFLWLNRHISVVTKLA
jgi:hypothetical protein